MDYAEEQKSEVEALMSIYEGDLQVIETEPYHVLTMPIKTEEYDEDSDEPSGLYVLLRISHTAKYPEQLPELHFEESENIPDECLHQLRQHLREKMEESVGMVMVFTIISATIEWLGNAWERMRNQADEIALMQKQKADEEEKRKLEGTKVTVETFMAWKDKFEAEFNIQLKKYIDPNKQTGKQMFLNNESLNVSDLEFLKSAGETVQVDEALFEDLDKLGLDDLDDDLDDELDDPDWVPN